MNGAAGAYGASDSAEIGPRVGLRFVLALFAEFGRAVAAEQRHEDLNHGATAPTSEDSLSKASRSPSTSSIPH